jgi:predicted MFS family arabinose efflux permease
MAGAYVLTAAGVRSTALAGALLTLAAFAVVLAEPLVAHHKPAIGGIQYIEERRSEG